MSGGHAVGCTLPNCDGTNLGHALAHAFPVETQRAIDGLSRLGGSREDRVMPENLRVDKPPLGLNPRRLHEDTRLHEIDAAIERYRADGWPVPVEWLNERFELLRRLEHEHDARCCQECGTHASPHVGCILR